MRDMMASAAAGIPQAVHDQDSHATIALENRQMIFHCPRVFGSDLMGASWN